MSGLEVLFGGLFGGLFASPVMVGAFALLIVLAFCAIMRLSFEGMFVVLMPLVMIFAWTGLLPLALGYVAAIACGFIIFMALMALMRG